MARAIWTGVLSFGLVTVPVGLYSATQDHKASFRQIQRGTSDRIRMKRVNERTGDEVDFKDIVKGYDLGDEEYVLIEPAELDEIAPGRSRVIEVSGFVDVADVEPVFFVSSYYLAPRGEEYAGVYALLLEALDRTQRAAVASFVMRGSQYLTLIRPTSAGVLELHTLHYADEVRDPATELPNLPDRSSVRSEQLAMATQLIEAMQIDWNPGDYTDEFQEKVRELIDAKRAGEEIVRAADAPEASNVLDLMELLRRSIDRRGGAEPAEEEQAATVTAHKPREVRVEADLGHMTKSQLAHRASELNIPGRSKMSRDELAAAVEKAEQRGAA